ncbi:spore coat assemly protein [Hathewaya proteolytica DSM 3090]|uniref:Spore coat assemly protein n=1 Tax=Hathewaya proteolytica DSM 3090 TaxID=1121331 RepID=A0A1M6S770_9CLOT|nr:sporulation peptidase YabG [Hathewaya proteolytica]SHK40551.1 spore coat assemly protein [Hathewaya proteolytica DSM 3090]
MEIGDFVVRKSYDKDITFKVIDIVEEDNKKIYMLKGVNLRIEADASEEDLEKVADSSTSKADIIFNEKISNSLRRVIAERDTELKMVFNAKKKETREKYREKRRSRTRGDGDIGKEISLDESKKMGFGRPGRILHIDGDPEYLEVCLKTYKQLSIEAVGKAIPEKDQPSMIVELLDEYKPDIVVITGHDGMIKHTTDYMNLENYRNTKYFVETVKKLRDYEKSYDDLVIFAGACQSCYEAILDAGANFASSPSRVLIHCLDPVLVCEKVAYTNIEKTVPIKDVIQNTITGIKGIGGLQTRGKYREGFPKSSFI